MPSQKFTKRNKVLARQQTMLLQLAKGREEEQRDPKSEEEDLIQHQDKRQDSTTQRYVKSYSNSRTESHNQNDIQTI